MLVQGNTVSVMGSYKDLEEVRCIVVDCIKNVNPVCHIKALINNVVIPIDFNKNKRNQIFFYLEKKELMIKENFLRVLS